MATHQVLVLAFGVRVPAPELFAPAAAPDPPAAEPGVVSPRHGPGRYSRPAMGSLIKKRRKRMRKKKHKKMLKRTRFQRRAAGK